MFQSLYREHTPSNVAPGFAPGQYFKFQSLYREHTPSNIDEPFGRRSEVIEFQSLYREHTPSNSIL